MIGTTQDAVTCGICGTSRWLITEVATPLVTHRVVDLGRRLALESEAADALECHIRCADGHDPDDGDAATREALGRLLSTVGYTPVDEAFSDAEWRVMRRAELGID